MVRYYNTFYLRYNPVFRKDAQSLPYPVQAILLPYMYMTLRRCSHWSRYPQHIQNCHRELVYTRATPFFLPPFLATFHPLDSQPPVLHQQEYCKRPLFLFRETSKRADDTYRFFIFHMRMITNTREFFFSFFTFLNKDRGTDSLICEMTTKMTESRDVSRWHSDMVMVDFL